MTFRQAPILETERLVLRPYRLEDFEPFADYFASDRSRHTDGPVSRLAAWDMFCAGSGRWSIVGHGAWAIAEHVDGDSLGLVSLNTAITLPVPELGWILWGGHEGRGIAFEAAKAARDFAFDVLGWPDLISGISKDNHRSLRLAERLGCRPADDIHLAEEPDTLFFRHVREEAPIMAPTSE